MTCRFNKLSLFFSPSVLLSYVDLYCIGSNSSQNFILPRSTGNIGFELSVGLQFAEVFVLQLCHIFDSYFSSFFLGIFLGIIALLVKNIISFLEKLTLFIDSLNYATETPEGAALFATGAEP